MGPADPARPPARHTGLLALALALGALLAAAAPASAQDWAWAEGRVVSGVHFEGLNLLHPSEARAMISTREREPFSSETLAADLARLYRSGRFGSPGPGIPPVEVTVRPDRDGTGVIVEFTVHESPRVVRVLVQGARGVSDGEIEEAVRTKAGDLLDPFRLERDARALRDLLQGAGFLMAEVRHRVDPRDEGEGVDVIFDVRPGPKVHVEAIKFVGARQLDPSDILGATGPDAIETKERQLFGFKEKGIYRPEAFRRDLDRIARWYRSQGFLDAQVYLLEERFSTDGEDLTLVVGVEEGQRYHIRQVTVVGNTVISEERILRDIPARPGRPFLGDDLVGSVQRIRHLYGQRAYIHADVDLDRRYDPERHLIDVVFRISEGPKVRIDAVRVEGNDKTREDVIRRELSFYPGEYFDADEVEASINRLGRLRYFEDVRVDFEPGSEPGREDVVLRVREARTGSIIVGGGVSTAAGFFGNIALTQRNFDILDFPRSWRDFFEGRAFTGAGQQFSISLQPGRERSAYSVEFVEPWLFGYPVILGLEAAARDRQREDWLETRRGGRVTLGYRFTQDLIFRATYRFERVRVSDIDFGAPPDVIASAGTNYVASIRWSLGYDQNIIDRNFVLYGGYAGNVYYELASKALGGDYSFHRAGAAANWQRLLVAWPGEHKWVLALRADVGWQQTLDGDPIPIFERFFAGGPNSLRGFRFRTVSPKQGRRPVGGDFMALLGAEVSFPLALDILRGVVFVDAGGATSRLSLFDDDDNFRVAAGFGFRLRVPVFPAPVALDFAWPILRRRDDDPQVFSFSVGFGF
ncbi:MAG: outer membrane protein assembly factor BamA [Planctomycetes bacterium]|nr:outer membrane protein assembly factor BamA [Planctomycetota bacterium]